MGSHSDESRSIQLVVLPLGRQLFLYSFDGDDQCKTFHEGDRKPIDRAQVSDMEQHVLKENPHRPNMGRETDNERLPERPSNPRYANAADADTEWYDRSQDSGVPLLGHPSIVGDNC